MKITISWTNELNSELSLRFIWIASTNNFESLLNWTQFNRLYLDSFMAKSKAHLSPSNVKITNYCRCIIPAMNGLLVSWKHNLNEVVLESNKHKFCQQCCCPKYHKYKWDSTKIHESHNQNDAASKFEIGFSRFRRTIKYRNKSNQETQKFIRISITTNHSSISSNFKN
jgi:hypothetical protein